MGSEAEQFRSPELNPHTEAARIQEFVRTLETIDVIKPVSVAFDFTDVQPVEGAIGRFQTYDELPSMPTLYVDELMAGLSANRGDDSLGAIAFAPRISRGGKSSVHGVFFGDLTIGEHTIPVAVKPHENMDGIKRSCLIDYMNNKAIMEQSLHTLEPFGFILGDNERAYSITILDEALTTFDSIDWSYYYEERDKHPSMTEMWKQVSAVMASLHSNGTTVHGDAHPRNIATNPEGGCFLIDWEKARISTVPVNDAEVQFGYTYKDLKAMLEGFCLPAVPGYKQGIGILTHVEDDWWDAFEEIFFADYRDQRLHYASQGSHHMTAERETHRELDELEASLRREAFKMRASIQGK